MPINESSFKYEIEKLQGSRIKVNVEVDAKEREQSLERAYKNLVKRYQVPGFRKGYTPRPVLEKYLGSEAFEDEAIRIVARDILNMILKNEKLTPLQDPYFDLLPEGWKENENLKFSIVIEIPPEFKLGDYKGFSIKREKIEVSEEEVDRVIEQIELQLSKLNSVEDGSVEKGDVVYLEREKEDGIQLPPLWFTLNGQMLPDLEEKLIGMRVGEEKIIEVNFPEDFYEKEIAGQTLPLKWRVKKIWRYEKPDKETFLQKVNANSLEEFRERVKESIREERERVEEDRLFAEILDKILETTELDPPLSYVHYLAENILKEFLSELNKKGLNLEDYLAQRGINRDEFVNNVIEDARRRIKIEMILDKIAEVENIEVSEEEVENVIKEIAENEGKDYKEIRRELEREGIINTLKRNMLREKVREFLIKENVVEEE
uniref:Trigger factor n=1 Tax=Dictyoglomus thermophilum TaxID=14 RepID=A0A7C2H9I7_DICTH